MDAMILAAGLGTRLRPLTLETPKPLIEVGGLPMIRHVADRLIEAGVDRLIVNVHHLGDQVERYLESAGLEAEIRISREDPIVLETGGGLWQAREHFSDAGPFFLHNSDVLSAIPLAEMYRAHEEGEVLATLAVMDRETARKLLFDEEGLLGYVNHDRGVRRTFRSAVGKVDELAFSGVHVVSPRIFDLITEEGAFSILDPYFRLLGQGEKIAPYRVDGIEWIDIGTHESLEEARANF